MLDMNPYRYDTVDYHAYELKVAKRNLELVTEAAVKRIRNATEETACEVAMEMCEAITIAASNVKSAEFSLKRVKEKEGNA